MPRVLLIVNPYSSSVTREGVAQVEAALRLRADVVTRLTESRGHAQELAAEGIADEADAIVVFSGDGTYNEAINGAAGTTPFGFIPGGGASVLARALGLPREVGEAAARVADALAEGRTRSIGLGRVNGRRFCFSAGIGVDAEAVRRIEARGRSEDGRRPNDLAFVATLGGVFARSRLRIEPQLEIVGHGRAAFVLVSCGRPYTYAWPLPVRVGPDREGLAFAAPERVTPGAVPRLLIALLRSRLPQTPGVLAAGGLGRLEVRCDRPLPLQADGEDLGDVTGAVFEAEGDALTVLV